jgi:hypothetical protein
VAFGGWLIHSAKGWRLGIQIRNVRADPSPDKIRIHPHFPSADATSETEVVSWVKAHHDSLHGRISIHWKRD